MTLRIKWICGMEPARDGEYPTMFEVGKNGVTGITAETENYGDVIVIDRPDWWAPIEAIRFEFAD